MESYVRKVTVLRGIPGSGKSTYAQTLNPHREICSADDYHMKNGIYSWSSENAGKAHGWCLRKFTLAVKESLGDSHVVVDNTNCAVWELAPYCALALAYDFELQVVTIPCDVETAIRRNVHNVPPETIRRMADLLDRHSVLIPKHWPHTVFTPEARPLPVQA